LAFLARSGADADTVRGLYGDFHEAAGNGGGVLDDAAVARLEKKWAPRIGAEAVATLKRWYVEQVREARREPCPASRYRRTRRRCCALCGGAWSVVRVVGLRGGPAARVLPAERPEPPPGQGRCPCHAPCGPSTPRSLARALSSSPTAPSPLATKLPQTLARLAAEEHSGTAVPG
jgi:hypothetical protein